MYLFNNAQSLKFELPPPVGKNEVLPQPTPPLFVLQGITEKLDTELPRLLEGYMVIDNMKPVFLSEEYTDLFSTNSLNYGWEYQKFSNHQTLFRARCKYDCDCLPAYELQPIYRDQSDGLSSMIKSLNAASVLSIR